MADDPETRRDVLEHFSDILAECLQGAATLRAGAFGGKVFNRVPRQMCRQRFAFGQCLGWCRRLRRRFGLAGMGILGLSRFIIPRQFAAPAFEFFQRQFQLSHRLFELLGTTTELHAPQFGDDELEAFDFGLLGADQRFEQGGVVGQ